MRCMAYVLGPLAVLLADEASAQFACSNRPEVLQYLADKYQETPVSIGLSSSGGVVEVLSAPAGGSWTILITMPNGMSCMVAAGEGWQSVPQTAQLAPSY